MRSPAPPGAGLWFSNVSYRRTARPRFGRAPRVWTWTTELPSRRISAASQTFGDWLLIRRISDTLIAMTEKPSFTNRLFEISTCSSQTVAFPITIVFVSGVNDVVRNVPSADLAFAATSRDTSTVCRSVPNSSASKTNTNLLGSLLISTSPPSLFSFKCEITVFMNNCQMIYSYLKASMGFNLEALLAG